MVMTLVAEKGLAALSTEQLVELYHGVAEAYGVGLMWEDEEIVERSKEFLRQLNEALDGRRREQG